ncbi:MAG: FAD-binding oxidoreductase [Gemmatimonadetes bacterium]|nr:FAD-binding oxidoreductase [Gemmatimonadota bacterium]
MTTSAGWDDGVLQAPDGFRGVFRTDDRARAVYSESAGIARILPDAVAVPADAEDVVTLVQWAAARAVPIVARGSATSMANGALGRGVALDLSRLNWIAAVDAANARVACGPGALRDTVDAAARAHGLRVAVDPSSGAFCTIGGMVATNAAGSRSVKLGAMRPWVHGLDCVFADGTRAWVRRGEPRPRTEVLRTFQHDVARDLHDRGATLARPGVRKESSGYALADYARSEDLVDLLVGSEGTLVIFVGIELDLAPVPPARNAVLASFLSLEEAVLAAGRATALGASAVELLDRTFLDVVRAEASALSIPSGADAVLLIEAEGETAADADTLTLRLADACHHARAAHVVAAPDEQTATRIWRIRHAASPILNALDPNLASMQLIEDGAVPPESFPDYVRGVRAALERHGIRGVIFGHAGDAHAHVNAMVDVRHPDWRSRARALMDDVTGLVALLGGTLAAEHGDGRLRTPLMFRVWDARAMALFARVKQAFDPLGVLNPGVKVPRAGDDPLASVKYDPTLPPLPADARAVLDRIVRERDWAAYRLGELPDV